jgi:chemotaxis protein MotA
VSASAPAVPKVKLTETIPSPLQAREKIDLWMMAGIAVAIGAVIAGIASAGFRIGHFFQPTGILIVVGGSLGVTLVTTPQRALFRAVRSTFALLSAPPENREAVMEEIVALSKTIRPSGIFGLEPRIDYASNAFLRESMILAMDSRNRAELQSMLETKLRQFEKQAEADARVFEVAGGFAPTIGVLGTVVGLMDVLRQFSNMASVAAGTGTAFVSTIYGLGLANLILLPTAQRMRAHFAEQFETNEMIAEGVLCLFEGAHPSLVRDRLHCFLHKI